jgi:LuxR family maltose regulon positive regulatory protein
MLLTQWLARSGAGALHDHAAQVLAAFGGQAHPAENAPGPAPARQQVEALTQRELEVLQLMALGCTNQEIARQLVVAPGTVKAHTASIYRKLDAANRTGAVARARELSLLP